MMNLALVGLPQAGKKTIFSLLTGLDPAKAPKKGVLAFGVATVRDPRIDTLTAMYRPQKTRYAEFEIQLPPDVTPEATRGAEWLAPLRLADALLVVIRTFSNPNIFHIKTTVDAARDVEMVDMEFLLADLDMVEKRLERMAKDNKKKLNTNFEREQALMERMKTHLEGQNGLRTMELTPAERELIGSLQLLTLKPLVVVLNTDEDSAAAEAALAPLLERLRGQGAVIISLCASIENEIAQLPETERAAFLADLGIQEPASHRLSRAVFERLGLICFFTAGTDEVRAWPVERGALAPQAAGKIHSDLERGFIRADTVAYHDLVAAGSEKAAREANKFRLNGKDYVVQDGDVVEIRFNV